MSLSSSFECGDVIAAVSHEVRQPLASIRGLTEMLLGHWSDFSDKDKTDMLYEVQHNAERVGRLIDELLEASRSEAGPLMLRQKETYVAALVARVAAGLRLSYPDLQVDVRFPPELPNVWVDPFKLEQVLANLLENAYKHGSPAHVVVAGVVKSTTSGGFVEISVSDKGNGIPPEELPHVTDKYFRGASSHQGGLGLGLWISKGIVEAHGGELVASSVPGQGATVRFTIPLHDDATAGKLAGK
jgi:signal transduction histidine kinase